MSLIIPAVERILLTLWVGGLWVTGFVVAPTLFTTLPNTSLAGDVAAALFAAMSHIGVVSGTTLLVLGIFRRAWQRRRWQMLTVIAMLLLVILGEYVLAPMIGDLRAAGQVASDLFARLHWLATALFGLNCLLGLVLVAAGRGGGTIR
ncbi:MAG: DUF4149 domain-containing protein [Gammaproteobacteria bacterium]|jgi:hypothetical protein